MSDIHYCLSKESITSLFSAYSHCGADTTMFRN